MLLKLLIWAACHEETGALCMLKEQMAGNWEAMLAETCRRWEERDRTPLIPPFKLASKQGKGKRKMRLHPYLNYGGNCARPSAFCGTSGGQRHRDDDAGAGLGCG